MHWRATEFVWVIDLAGLALAAIPGQISQNLIHLRIARAINQVAPYALARDQIRLKQFLQMKRERVAGMSKASAITAGVRPSLPFTTRARKMCRRLLWASAARALMTSVSFIFR